MARATREIEAKLWSRTSIINGILAIPGFDVAHNTRRMSGVLTAIQSWLKKPITIYAGYIGPQVNVLTHWQLPPEFEDGRGALIACPAIGTSTDLCNQLQGCSADFEQIVAVHPKVVAVSIPMVGEPFQRIVQKVFDN